MISSIECRVFQFDAKRKESEIDPGVTNAAPKIEDLALLGDDEIAALIRGYQMALGPVSFYEHFLDDGVYVRDQDRGIRRRGTYVIEDDAVFTTLPGREGHERRRFYRAPDGKVFQLFSERAHLMPLKIVGPSHAR